MTSIVHAKILVVDDDQALLEVFVRALKMMGHDTQGESNAQQGLARVKDWEPDVAIFDLRMPDLDGLELLQRALVLQPDLPVILLTAHGSIETAVQAVRQGAYDFLEKPFELSHVELVAQKALALRSQTHRYRLLAETTGRRGDFEGIIGKSVAIQKVIAAVSAVADTDSTVLISGETGTGKELVARAVHTQGARQTKPYVTVDCAAIPDNLLESELFGHIKGAFTGALREHAGYFEAAADGTVFLDEIGEIPSPLQKKLLRILQEKTFTRVGDGRPRRVDARIVAATNRNLGEEVSKGRFREDLFYRLNVIEIALPPLRKRVEDIPLLVQYFIERLNRKLNRKVSKVSDDTLAVFFEYFWPGNVRELLHVLEQVMTFHHVHVLEPAHLPPALRAFPVLSSPNETYAELKEHLLDEAGAVYFQKLMHLYHGNITKIATHAGLNRRHLHRLLQKLAIDATHFRHQ